MSGTAKKQSPAGVRYLELVRAFPLRPLRTKAEYARATKILDALASRTEGSLSLDEQDYLGTLALLAEEFDARHAPQTPKADPIDVLRHLMDAHDMNTADLGRLLGSKGVASEVLSGKRPLSKAHIAALAAKFHVDAGVFFPPAQTGRQRRSA
jgi:HTH-type transcriptional regulator/antitoxin HigA